MSVIWHPQDAAEAIRLKETFGAEGRFISGGTWLSVQWENGAPRPGHLIDVSAIPAMRGIAVQSKALTLGAMTPLSVARRDPLIGKSFPLLREAARSIAAPSIRNLGTIGGNIACKTGDLLPALLVCDAELNWHDGHRLITESASDWLNGTRGETKPPDGLLLQVKLALKETPMFEGAAERVIEGYHKIGRREAFTPSVVTAAYRAVLSPEGVVQSIRLAAGGGLMIPQRLTESESLLIGRMMSPKLMERLYEVILREVQPRQDAFVSCEYRKQTTAAVMSAGLWQTYREAASA
ncbi:FAD binding domain-containing protein [Paenibacillus sacheonensis]|uniref:Xanthine dehydrogenase n=1 Tax=Paenibacillus sacheonensis TaxID=742054 RepID=A0A7X4YKM6_9BACL|nr:FAD binding domain-containing protein [Paenibacillus sacheonensis]MBM7563305.1 carbon-monoxide dehydrogenase medium subunit [Paenibacillus sacheonensis]NBC68137.1 xanthine dehydrogenase [Paenibacillus sacheonensis]